MSGVGLPGPGHLWLLPSSGGCWTPSLPQPCTACSGSLCPPLSAVPVPRVCAPGVLLPAISILGVPIPGVPVSGIHVPGDPIAHVPDSPALAVPVPGVPIAVGPGRQAAAGTSPWCSSRPTQEGGSLGLSKQILHLMGAELRKQTGLPQNPPSQGSAVQCGAPEATIPCRRGAGLPWESEEGTVVGVPQATQHWRGGG